MNPRVYYYRMRQPLAHFCELQEKSLPKLDVLEQIARRQGLPFYPDQFPAARDCRCSMEDGMVFAIAEYLALPAKTLVEITDLPPAKQSKKGLDDLFLRGVEWLASQFHQSVEVPAAAWTTSRRKITEAVKSLHKSVGMHAKNEGTVDPITPDEEAADQVLHTTRQVVIEKILAWKQFNESTTLLAHDTNKTRVGMSTILPLTESAYEKVRTGQVRNWDLTEADLDLMSTHLLIFALGEWSDRLESVTKKAATRAVFRCTVAQFGRLVPTGAERSCRCLAMATHHHARAQLLANRFRPCGTVMPGTPIPVYELILSELPWVNFPALIRQSRIANGGSSVRGEVS